VSAGARIGTIGSTGEANGIHLHLTLRIGDVLVDPLDGIATLNNSLYLNAR
jgi:murein DD-endopeptidase MepM/ murein hydrolase activator NlpD